MKVIYYSLIFHSYAANANIAIFKFFQLFKGSPTHLLFIQIIKKHVPRLGIMLRFHIKSSDVLF